MRLHVCHRITQEYDSIIVKTVIYFPSLRSTIEHVMFHLAPDSCQLPLSLTLSIRPQDDDEGVRLIYLPLFDTVSLNVVQSLGFTVFIFFLLLSAYSFISLKTGTIARDGSPQA